MEKPNQHELQQRMNKEEFTARMRKKLCPVPMASDYLEVLLDIKKIGKNSSVENEVSNFTTYLYKSIYPKVS